MKQLYYFQQEAVNKALGAPGLLIADECGLGKTITALEIAKVSREKFSSHLTWRCLIVCPPSLIKQWIVAIDEQDLGQDVHVPGRLPYAYLKVNGYVIMSYYDLLHEHTLASLSALMWDCMIVDEAHRIKNRKAKTVINIKKIMAARKIALSGTPMEKTPADLWSILNFLNPYAFPAYWGWVLTNMNVTAGYFEKYKIGAPKDPDAFGKSLSPFMIRRTKEEVAPQLPEKILVEEPVAMDSVQQTLYDTIKHNTDIEIKVAGQTMLVPNALSLITRLMQISSYPPMLGFNDATSGKLAWLDDFLSDHEDEATVIFTRFRATAIYIADKYKCDMIIGGDRRETWSGTGPRRLVGTIDSMGEGLNLQWAKNAVFVDSHWSTIKMTQAIDRIHRIDIKEPKNIYLLWSCREDKLVIDAINQKWTESELVYYFLNESIGDSASAGLT